MQFGYSNNRHGSIAHQDNNFTVALKDLDNTDDTVQKLVYYNDCTRMDYSNQFMVFCTNDQ